MKFFVLRPIACALAALLLVLPAAAGCSDGEVAESPPQYEAAETDDGVKNEQAPPDPEPEGTPETDPEPGETEPAPAEPPAEPEPEPPAEEPAKPAVAQYVFVKTNGLNVRTGAGTGYTVLGQAEQNTLLTYEGRSGNWYKTYFKNRTAYVSARTDLTALVELETGSERVEAVVAEGQKLLGTPYVYGAVRLHDGKGNFLKNFTVTKFDCSSLTQYVFYVGAGALLDVTTRTQVAQGTAVTKADLRRGDLLFFTNSSRYDKTGLERIGHVALYLGDNYILHTASDYAKIEQISAQRWRYYITARRMI